MAATNTVYIAGTIQGESQYYKDTSHKEQSSVIIIIILLIKVLW